MRCECDFDPSKDVVGVLLSQLHFAFSNAQVSLRFTSANIVAGTFQTINLPN